MTEQKDKNGLTEAEYLSSYRRDGWPLPSVTADQVLISPSGSGYEILLVRRGGHPCINQWALPGGFVNEQEPPWKAAARELEEETSLSGLPPILLGVFGDPNRDVRGWTITCAYCALVSRQQLNPQAGDDAREACWFRLSWERQDGLLRICLTASPESQAHTLQAQEASPKDPACATQAQDALQKDQACATQAQDAFPEGCIRLTALLRPLVLENPIGQDTHYELLENDGLAFDHAKIIATAIPHLERLANP